MSDKLKYQTPCHCDSRDFTYVCFKVIWHRICIVSWILGDPHLLYTYVVIGGCMHVVIMIMGYAEILMTFNGYPCFLLFCDFVQFVLYVPAHVTTLSWIWEI